MARECSFCDPAELAERVIHNDLSSVFSVLSNPSMTEFHSLIIPRRHVEPTNDILTEEEIVETEYEKDRLTDIFRALGFKGVDTFQKTRPDVPQGTGGTKMNHLHTHILPSNPGTELYERGLMWGGMDAFKVLDRQSITNQLRNIWEVERRA
jgi:diadenosine tetraphosphate (Ap4A) HIT family hydrolase